MTELSHTLTPSLDHSFTGKTNGRKNANQISGRVSLIVAVLLLALWAIFPSGNFKHPDLKPGIDMVGGTSLLYEIKPPEGGGFQGGNLAEQVMESLKKRVDPDGVRNLIWRPQGNTRLEIQMPLHRQISAGRRTTQSIRQSAKRY